MERVVVVDTCTLFEFMAGKIKNQRLDALLVEARAAVSVITVYELFRGVENAEHIKQREELIHLCSVMELTLPISRKAAGIRASLRKKGRMIAHEDILIAATAMHLKSPLLTLNKKDFSLIPELKLY